MRFKTEKTEINSDKDWIILEMSNIELKNLISNLEGMVNYNTHDDAVRRYAIFPDNLTNTEKEEVFEKTR